MAPIGPSQRGGVGAAGGGVRVGRGEEGKRQ